MSTLQEIPTASKRWLKGVLENLGLDVRLVPPVDTTYANIPDYDLYDPLFSPWTGGGEFRKYYEIAAPKTLVSAHRCYVLYVLLRQALQLPGDIWECGVYKGGTAAMMAAIMRDKRGQKKLHLFDTFEGMPETDGEKDLHRKGDFADTSLDVVASYGGADSLTVFHKGFISATFSGLDTAQVALAHIDVDIYQSIIDCLEFIWPRLSPGGFTLFDDYGFPSCPGARMAVDQFFEGKASFPLCLHTGQALIFKGGN